MDTVIQKHKDAWTSLGKLLDRMKEYDKKSGSGSGKKIDSSSKNNVTMTNPYGGTPYSNRAVGGSMTSGNMYMVGENGPEMFIPSSNGRIEKNPQGSATISINFNNPVVRSDADLDALVRAVKQSLNNDTRLAQYGVAI